ncbi:MAG: hypothetical protein JXB50_14180 [Spirochaetes bacterium]|nr:hypothetical protein [Spirochaetota bacterium]
MIKEVNFTLPVGFIDHNGIIHRKGIMRQATALDEIEIHNHEKMYSCDRYHDILLLSRVIKSLGEIKNIDDDVILNLFEADFRYLQTIYQQLNGSLINDIQTHCPECGQKNKLNLYSVFDELELDLSDVKE